MDAYTSTMPIGTNPDTVFAFLADPLNQPRWAVNFVKSTRPAGDGTYVMETPIGEIPYRFDAEPSRRVVDIVLLTPAGEQLLPLRVTPHGPGSIVTFTIARTPGQPDAAWEAGTAGLDEELATLRDLLEAS